LFHKYVLHDTEKAVLPASKKAGATVAGRVVGYFGSRLISASTLRMSVSVPV
jgi:PII-like signaling protein